MKKNLQPKAQRQLMAVCNTTTTTTTDGLTVRRGLKLELQDGTPVYPVSISSDYVGQTWSFWYLPDGPLPTSATLADTHAITAVSFVSGRLAIDGDALQELTRCAPAFLSAVVDLHSVQVPRREQRLPVSLWLKRA